MAEYDSPFKPIVSGSDYLSGSEFGQVAGALLARRDKQDKKQARKALLASAVLETFGTLQRNQKQDVIDAINETNEKYSDIFSTNKAEFESYSDERNEVEEYQKNKKVYLNNKTTEFIDGTDEVVAARVKWADVDKQPNELRNSMYAAWNKHREELQNKMEALSKDPRVTSVSFEEFNKLAKEEYKAAIDLVKNDPTKKSLIAAAWNRIFKTKKDDGGELVTTNTELLDLQESLNIAKDKRTTFRDTIENQVVEKQLYEPLVFKPKPQNRDEINFQVIPSLQNLVKDNEKYKNVDSLFYVELIDDIVEENPSATAQQIGEKAYSALLKGEVNPTSYLNKQGLKIANRESLILAFEAEENQDAYINNNPFKLFQLVDAYKAQGNDGMTTFLLTKYENLITTKKDFNPTEQEKLSNVQRIRGKLDKKIHKSILKDTDALGVLSANVAYAENYFKSQNPNWNDTYTEVELKEAATNFIIGNMIDNPTEIRMTQADLLAFRKAGTIFDLSLIDEIPTLINELKQTDAPDSKIKQVRDSFITEINNPQLELEDDEILELTNKINSYFSDSSTETETSTGTETGTKTNADKTPYQIFLDKRKENREAQQNLKTLQLKQIKDFQNAISLIKTDTVADNLISYFALTQSKNELRKQRQPLIKILKDEYNLTLRDLTGLKGRVFAENNPELAREITDLIINFKPE
tara:strand:- start:1184 stop:3271 length:2088 start_codon:yes stop_codon:yes gene_type:complete